MIGAIRRRIARPFRDKARKAQSRQQWAEALLQLEIADRICPENLAIVLQIGNMHSELGQFDQAAQCYERVALSKSFKLRGLIGTAGLAERRNDWHGAVVRWDEILHQMALDQASGIDQGTWPMSASMAMIHCALSREMIGDRVGAERDLVLAIALQPAVRRSREAALMRARMAGQSDQSGAFRILRAAHRRYPDDCGILSELAQTAQRTGRREEGLHYARLLVGISPLDSHAVNLLKEMEG